MGKFLITYDHKHRDITVPDFKELLHAVGCQIIDAPGPSQWNVLYSDSKEDLASLLRGFIEGKGSVNISDIH